MAPKRSAQDVASDNEDEDQLATQQTQQAHSPKRARTDAGPSQSQTQDEEQAEEEEDEEVEEEEEDEDEVAHARAALGRRALEKPTIAEMGVIEKVDLRNFMCHKLHTTTFKPQINFIIGHNGSGKSAVLTAITVALGGKASTTNRAAKISDLIKNGTEKAVITVHLKNRGAEAFEPDNYGETIVIERTIPQNGSASYKLMSSDGHIVSRKREDLQRMLDHFMIQVDNPITVLSQDLSRRFLSSSNPRDKYQFFLRGTQLSQLDDEYRLITRNLETTSSLLSSKKANIPDMKRAFQQVREQWKQIQQTRDQAQKVEQLKKDLSWSYVAGVENEMMKMSNEVETEKYRLPKYQSEIDRAQKELDDASAKYIQLEKETNTEVDDDALRTEKERLEGEIKTNKEELKRLKDSRRTANSHHSQLKTQIRHLDSQIQREVAKQSAQSVEQRQRSLDRVAELEAEIRKNGAALIENIEQQRQLRESMEPLRKEYQDVKTQEGEASDAINQARNALRQLESNRHNELGRYGGNIPILVQEIEKASWADRRPLGPLGKYIKLKDRKWADVIETILSGTLNAFLVTNNQDRDKLQKMISQFRVQGVTVIKQAYDPTFDFSRGEPAPEFLTVLRSLTFQEDFVRNVCIDSNKIEKFILVENGIEADRIMEYPPPNVAGCYDIDCYSHGGVTGGAQTVAINKIRSQRLVNDIQNVIRQAQEDHEATMRHHEGIAQRLAELDKQLRFINKQIKDAESGHQNLVDSNKAMGIEAQSLKDAIKAQDNIQIATLEEEKSQLQDEVHSAVKQYAELEQRLAVVTQENIPKVERVEVVAQLLDEGAQRRAGATAMLHEAERTRRKMQKNLTHYIEKKTQQEQRIAALEAHYLVKTDEHQEKVADGEKMCERPPKLPTKGPEKLAREINGLERAVAEREKIQGTNHAELGAELKARQEALKAAENSINDVQMFVAAMSKSLDIRIHRWECFRTHIGTRAKLQFSHYLSQRGYTGKIAFDHDKLRLNLKVHTDQQNAQARHKDPNALSGGEKSFSTICLLMTLWEAIGCPLRCLDEFDVFQDAVNRRISMKMMVDTAKMASATQFVLITPQDMSTVVLGKECHVVRMADPSRSQGQLQTGNN